MTINFSKLPMQTPIECVKCMFYRTATLVRLIVGLGLLTQLQLDLVYSQVLPLPQPLSSVLSNDHSVESGGYSFFDFQIIDTSVVAAPEDILIRNSSAGKFNGIELDVSGASFTHGTSPGQSTITLEYSVKRIDNKPIGGAEFGLAGVQTGSSTAAMVSTFTDISSIPSPSTPIGRADPLIDSEEATIDTQRLPFSNSATQVEVVTTLFAGSFENGETVSFSKAYHRFLTSSELVPGDYDIDFNVDGKDYLLWQRNYGLARDGSPSTITLIADGNNDGVVDAADYTVWRDNYGTGLPGVSSASIPLPEPSCLAMVLVSIAAFSTAPDCLLRRKSIYHK